MTHPILNLDQVQFSEIAALKPDAPEKYRGALLGPIGQGLVIRAALCQAYIAHGLLERILVKLAGPRKVHIGNGGAFFDHHHQHVAVGLQANVLEQAQTKKSTNGRSALFIVVGADDGAPDEALGRITGEVQELRL